MGKKTLISDDVTGDYIIDAIHIEVSREGYNVVLPDGSITNRAILDVAPGNEDKIMKKLKYVEITGLGI